MQLEFKVVLADLIRDFDSDQTMKDFVNCDLIIVWNGRMTNVQRQDFRLVNRDAVPTSSVRQDEIPDWLATLIANRSHVYKPIILVEEWVKELDPSFASK